MKEEMNEQNKNLNTEKSNAPFTVTVNGSDISEFSLVCESAFCDCGEKIAQKVGQLTGAHISKAEKAYENGRFIVISESEAKNLDRAQAGIEISDNITIFAKGKRINDAVEFFCQSYLSTDRAKNGKIELDSADGYVGDIISNPIAPDSCPDPFVKYVDGYYYTIFTAFDRLELYRSRHLSTLINDQSKVVYKGGDNVIKADIWAPEFYFDKGRKRWYIYSNGTLVPGDLDTQRLFCLESETDDIFSDYHFKGLIDPDTYCIDSSPYYNEYTDTLYFSYALIGGGQNQVCIAKMDNPFTINEQSRRVICHAEYDWELHTGRVNEGGCFIEQGGELYLAFSANNGDSKPYCVGLLKFLGDYKKDDLNSPELWQKLDRPLLKAGGGIFCTGHNSFFRSPDGSELWIAFHGRTDPAETTWHRPLCFKKAELDKDGRFIMDTTPIGAGIFFKEPSAK